MMTSRNYKVSELCDMIMRGELCTNQSTQRKFVYADMDTTLLSGGSTTKAGAVLNSILEGNIQLPPLYFWRNTDTGHLNVLDGKQRLLSIFYFMHPSDNINVSTVIKGKTYSNFEWLPSELRDRLLNYEFCVMTTEGDSLSEEEAFYAINTNSVPLTDYECLSGMYHGRFLTEFENYIMTIGKTRDSVNEKIGRGAQALNFLLTMFGRLNQAKNARLLNISNDIRCVRDNEFDPHAYSFDRLLDAFNEACRTIKGIKEPTALFLADMLVRRNYDVDSVLDLYRRSLRLINDVKSWDSATHQAFVEAYVNEGRELDPQRFFTKDVKDELYRRSPRCSHVDDGGKRCQESNYSKLEVDHVVPWRQGGRTVIDNAQLLCKHHNAGKGARI